MRSLYGNLDLGIISAFALKTQGNQERKRVSGWPVAGPSEHRHLASNPATKVDTSIHILEKCPSHSTQVNSPEPITQYIIT